MLISLPLISGFVLVFFIVPGIREIALRFGFVDRPTKRKIHDQPIPLMGGVAIYIGCILSLALFTHFSDTAAAIFWGGSALLVIGLLDDWFKANGKEFPVWPRLLTYLIVSAVPLWLGIQIIGVTNVVGSGMILFPHWLAGIATMAWVFGLTNMINFIDGVDGLASGIVTISSLTLMIIALLKGQTETAVLAATLAGASLAFLAYNFHPAKIFLGDAGAVFLGYSLSVIAIDGAFKSATLISLFVPILALGVPIMDTIIVFIRRFKEGKGLHRADKLHTHHTLLNWGLTQTQVVSFLYLVGAVFSLLSIILVLIIR